MTPDIRFSCPVPIQVQPLHAGGRGSHDHPRTLADCCEVDDFGRVLLDGEHIGYLSWARGAWVATTVCDRDVLAVGERDAVLQVLLDDPARPGRLF